MLFLPLISLLSLASAKRKYPTTVTFHDQVYTITGPTTLSWASTAEIVKTVTGVNVETIPTVIDVAAGGGYVTGYCYRYTESNTGTDTNVVKGYDVCYHTPL